MTLISQDVISHVATAHVRSINQGKKDSAQVIHTLSTVYDRWRAKVNATLAQAQVSLTAAGTRPSGSAAALRAGTNLGRDLADIPKTVPDPVDDLKDHSTRSMITRATQVLQNSNSSTARASTAGKAGTGTMTAADILNDVRSSLEGNDVGSTDSSANTAAQLLRDAAASHDDTMTAGTARIAGAAAAAATTGAAGEHAMTAEDVLLDATSDGGFEFEASAGKALTAGSNTMSAADVMNDIASSQAAVGIGDIGDATLQDPRRSAGSQALPAEVQITQGHHSTEFSLGDIDNMDYGDMGSTDLLGEFGSDAGSSGHDSAAAATIRNAASQAQPTRDLENEMKSEDDENMSHGLPQHATSRAASGETH